MLGFETKICGYLKDFFEFADENELYFERIRGESSLRRGSVADFSVTSAVDTLLG